MSKFIDEAYIQFPNGQSWRSVKVPFRVEPFHGSALVGLEWEGVWCVLRYGPIDGFPRAIHHVRLADCCRPVSLVLTAERYSPDMIPYIAFTDPRIPLPEGWR